MPWWSRRMFVYLVLLVLQRHMYVHCVTHPCTCYTVTANKMKQSASPSWYCNLMLNTKKRFESKRFPCFINVFLLLLLPSSSLTAPLPWRAKLTLNTRWLLLQPPPRQHQQLRKSTDQLGVALWIKGTPLLHCREGQDVSVCCTVAEEEWESTR